MIELTFKPIKVSKESLEQWEKRKFSYVRYWGDRALWAAIAEGHRRLAEFEQYLERRDLALHPNGKCTCYGEGRCDWCEKIYEETTK